MGSVNLTIAALLLGIALIPELIAVVISLRGYVKTHYKVFVYLFCTWTSLWVSDFFIMLAYLFTNFGLYQVGLLSIVPLAFSTIFLVDHIVRDHLHPWKLFFMSVLTTAFVIFSFREDAFDFNISSLGETNPSTNGIFSYMTGVIYIYVGLLWFSHMLRIYRHSSPKLKPMAHLNLIGATLAGPGAIIIYVSGLVWMYPGLDYILISIGALFLSVAFWNQPKLANILPFTVYKLMVVDSHGSIPLYTHQWKDLENDDSALFSGAMIGITGILKEALGGWKMTEIDFDRGRLIVTYTPDVNLMFVLITSESTSILREGLQLFMQRFITEFKEELKHREGNLRKFARASQIIEETFPFVVN